MDFETEIKQLRAKRADATTREVTLRSDADTLVEKLRGEGTNPLTDATAFEQVDKAYLRADEVKDEIAGYDRALSRALEIAGEKAAERGPKGGNGTIETREAATIAQRFMAHDQIVQLRESGALRHDARVETAPIQVLTRDEFMDGLRLRTTIDNSSGSAGGLIWSDRRPNLVVPIPQRRVRLLDVISIDSTDSDTIEYVRETTHTDAADGTPYGTALPESAYGYTKDNTTVVRVGHWVPATKGALADAGQMRGIIDRNLMQGQTREIERQVWNGGGGNDLTGFLGQVTNTQARGSDSYHDAFHKSITKLRLLEIDDPTAFVINPTDYETIVLEKDNANNYINRRGVTEINSLWGMTPVVTTLAASGTAVVGDYSQIVLYVREGVVVAASDSHSDFFLKGLVAVKAEGRYASVVLQKRAFCKVTGL